MPSAATKIRKADTPQTQAGLFSSPEKRTFILCLLLVVATLAVYNPVNRNAFVNFDDDRYIVDNPHVHAGLRWETVKWAFTTYEMANWHPLTWISYALDYSLFKLNPAGPHYVNVLFHAANVVLLFLLLQRATGFTWRSLMVAVLFAVHPMNVESVAWAAERKNVLSMLFFLLSMLAYGSYARNPSVRRYASVALWFAAGLMAKPQIITLPFILLLWDYWPLGRMGLQNSSNNAKEERLPVRSMSRLVVEKTPLFLLSIASAVVTMKAQSAGGAVRTTMGFTFSFRLENAIVAYARYLGKAFWPSSLSPMYPHPGSSLPAWQVALSTLLLVAIAILVVVLRREKYLAMGWCWFLGTLVPMIGLVQVGEAALADRYAYLPFLGLFIMLSWGVPEAARKAHLPPARVAIPAGLAVLALSAVTYRQVGLWRNSETLWKHALAATENNFVAHDNLGGALVNQGRTEEAIPHFRAAVAIRPDDPLGHLDIGAYEQEHGNLQTAIKQYQMVLRFTSDATLREQAFANLGSAYRNQGMYALAQQNYEAALGLNPDNSIAVVGMGLIAQRNGDMPQAINRYSHAMSVQPTSVGYLLLANALQRSGRAAEAQAAREQAQQLSPDLSESEQAVDRLLEH